jgi:hypothetical protein
MVEMMIFGALLLFMVLYGTYVDWDVDRKAKELKRKCKAKEPRLKEREDYWAA